VAGLIVIILIFAYYKYATRRPKYGTQEYLDWKYKDMPGDKEYWKAIEKKNMGCTYGDIPMTPSEKAAYNKVEKENGRSGIE